MSLSELPNIGPKLEALLQQHGIETPADLRRLGAVRVCQKMQLRGEPCVNKLYALEGAIRGVRWREIPEDERAALRREFLGI